MNGTDDERPDDERPEDGERPQVAANGEHDDASEERPSDSKAPSLDDLDMRALLRRALDAKVEAAPSRAIVRGVQERLRQESRGAFFADGWGRAAAPKHTYLVTSLVMLAALVLTWWLLGPHDVH